MLCMSPNESDQATTRSTPSPGNVALWIAV